MTERRNVPWAISLAAVVIACHLPLVWVQLQNLWFYRPHYQFFPLLLAGIGWLLWQRWPRWALDAKPPWWSTVLLVGGWLTLALAVVLWAHWLATVALILSVAGLIGRFAARGQWRDWVPVWLLLWLMVPPPLGLDFRLINWLQGSTSQMASRVMDLMGILHLMEGNVLVLPGHRMLVDEACSGVNSVLVLLVLTGLYVVAVRRPLIWAALLMASSVAWAWAGNTVRVTTIAVAQAWFDVDLSTGWQHEVLGYVTISLALLWLISTDYCLSFLLNPIVLRRVDLSQFATGFNPFTGAWNWLMGAGPREKSTIAPAEARSEVEPAVGPAAPKQTAPDSAEPPPGEAVRSSRAVNWLAAFGLMGMLQVAGFAVSMTGRSTDRHVDRASQMNLFQQTDLPASLEGWDVVGYEVEEREQGALFGQFSSRWHLQRGTLESSVSVDRPFWGWHDLSSCYQGTGWEMLNRQDVGQRDRAERNGCYVQAQFSRPTGEFGSLVFGLSDPTGNHLVPPLSGLPRPRLYDRLRRNPLASRLLGEEYLGSGTMVYQIQVFATTSVDLSPDQRDELKELFFAFREKVVGGRR